MRAGRPSGSCGDDAILNKGLLCEDLGGDLDVNDGALQDAPNEDELLILAKNSDLAPSKEPGCSICILFSKDFNQGACLSPVLEFLKVILSSMKHWCNSFEPSSAHFVPFAALLSLPANNLSACIRLSCRNDLLYRAVGLMSSKQSNNTKLSCIALLSSLFFLS